MMQTPQHVHATIKCRRVSFDPLMNNINNNNNMNSSIQTHQGDICRKSPPSSASRPVASFNNMPSHKIIPSGSSSTSTTTTVLSIALGRQLKRLRDSNTVNEAQTAILALVPIIHRWIQNDLKTSSQGLSSDNSNISSRHDHQKNTQHQHACSTIRKALYAETTMTASLSTTSASEEFLHELHGVSILILTLKEWETCPLVVATTLRILAFLVGTYPPIGQALVEMGGLRILVRSISKYHSSKNGQVVTACVALFSELAQHMPSTVASDACLALVVHGLWRFPKNGLLQGFGCLFLERVLVATLMLQQQQQQQRGVVAAGQSESSNKSLNAATNNKDETATTATATTTDTWSVTSVHQRDTLKKVVVPLLIRMGKYHSSSNPAICQRAQHLFRLIHQRLNNKVGLRS